MMICRACHRLIEGLTKQVVVKAGSLADRGDDGRGITPLWLDHIARTRA